MSCGGRDEGSKRDERDKKKGGSKNGRSIVEMGAEEVKIEREQRKKAVQENNIKG